MRCDASICSNNLVTWDEDECWKEERANPSVISHFGINLMNFPHSALHSTKRNWELFKNVCTFFRNKL